MSHQSHRGPASEDGRLFGSAQLPALREAAADLCWLLDRDYAARSAVELVGNRYSLTARQRMALSRYACTESGVLRRREHRLDPAAVRGRELWIDGYNVLTLIESALSGGVILLSRDACCRDIAGIHRRYRKINETIPALQLVGETLASWGVSGSRWLLDKPVSNSGRVKTLILETAKAHGWKMEAELAFSPDHVLSHTDNVVASSDGIILNRCGAWVNLAWEVIVHRIPGAWLVDFTKAAKQES